jgi:coproporphyrinogen III oxidase-like Fe-S oxidoreductase
VFNRRYNNELIINISRDIAKRKLSICDFDFTGDVPWETTEDRLEGLRLLSRMKPPFTINISHLTFFPGSALTERAIREGIVDKDQQPQGKDIFNIRNDFINFLYVVYGVFHIPESALKHIINSSLVREM